MWSYHKEGEYLQLKNLVLKTQMIIWRCQKRAVYRMWVILPTIKIIIVALLSHCGYNFTSYILYVKTHALSCSKQTENLQISPVVKRVSPNQSLFHRPDINCSLYFWASLYRKSCSLIIFRIVVWFTCKNVWKLDDGVNEVIWEFFKR